MSRKAFSLIELVVVLGIIGLLLAITIPAVQSAREASRRTQCQSNLRQFGIAMHNYHDVHRMFPPGNNFGASMHVCILPYIDQENLYRTIPADVVGLLGPHNFTYHRIPMFNCQSDHLSDRPTTTNYAMNFGTGVQTYGYNGMFKSIADGPIKSAHVTDGLSATVAMAETLVGSKSAAKRLVWRTPYELTGADQLEHFAHLCRQTAETTAPDSGGKGRPWTDGNPPSTVYNHILFPNDVSCMNASNVPTGAYSAASMHSGGIYVLMGDGHVRFLSGSIDFHVWRGLGSRDGGEIVSN
ncbi:MAG: DUF1559 domain-containing protein [Planctomycetaceae bacterium]